MTNKELFKQAIAEAKTIREAALVNAKAALEEARHEYENIENKQSEEAGPAYRRLKVAGYFQAAIKLELETN